jgi:hypothetical protein
VKLQTTTAIQAKTRPSKDIPRPTTSFGEDSHEDLITFDNSPHLHRHELEAYIDPQISSQLRGFLEMFDIEKIVFISIHIVALSIPKMFHEVISKIIMSSCIFNLNGCLAISFKKQPPLQV